ncbi:MAG TPA: c-type cytochrome [Trueperaceae bacterium]|nr:c-type cytochrome [Trueperaceae bacterium]
MTPRIRTHRAVLATVAIAIITFAALAAGGDTGLTLSTHPDLGSALADQDGNFLYLFSNDAQGESKCYDSCATNWPPFVSDAEVTVGEGLDPALVGTTARTDGTAQVTYGGWPLYTFIGDTEPGMAAGQGLNDVWFLVSATGEAVTDAAAGAAETGEQEGVAADDEADPEDALFATYMDEGATVFATICAACHGAQGNEELSTHVALLAGNSRLENARLVIRRVIHGGTYMPPFGTTLSDREVAAVATFVRNSFGNEYGFVGEEEAAAMR